MPKIESKINNEQLELNAEQKMALGEAWVGMIVDNNEVPISVAKMNQEELKQWFFTTMMLDVEKLTHEFGLETDTNLIEKIKTTEIPNEKATLEVEYIKKIHEQVDGVARTFDELGHKSTKWDSWPKKIREDKGFNCVGATLLGMVMLEKAGIKSYYGNPHGHVINIARLANDDWWYVDFRNGPQNVLKIEPEKLIVNDVKVLKIDVPAIDYKIIPIYENAESVGSILGNLAALKNEAENNDQYDDDEEKTEVIQYIKKYQKYFDQTDFSSFQQSLYPKFNEFHETEIMQKEAARINGLMDFEKPVQDYFNALSTEQRKVLQEDFKVKKTYIKNLFLHDDDSVLSEASLELKRVLELFVNGLEKIKTKRPGVYQEVIKKIFQRLE